MSKAIISVSLLSCDLGNFAKDLKILEDAKADWLHLDVMDGCFVPMITIGSSLIPSIKANSLLPLDVHLMTKNLEQNIPHFANADWITVHAEATDHLHRAVQQIKSMGIKAGIALNPATPLYILEELLADVDLVLLMAINPAFPKQSFIKSTLNKIQRLKTLRKTLGLDFIIGVDGGVKLDNAAMIVSAGADMFVSGSAIYKNNEVNKNIQEFRKEIQAS